MTHLVVDFPAIAFERVGPLESPGAQYSMIREPASSSVVTAVIAWRSARGRLRPSDVPRSPRLALWSAAALLIAFVIVVVGALADPMEIVFGIPRSLLFALALPIGAAILTAVSLGFALVAWRRRYPRLPARLDHTVVALAAAALLAVLWYWNLLGYHLH